ncbi:hypothetical protein [Clostridium ganghwense]|uniref:DUF304 domain-containing protein n=1 Tax=Clostridium ganghwense TaxID=312089 RepID=A0ABT4CU99_9CLOT|nr:hypothetical protein [Clostridium ganghwense]MCY6372624.1 hypothetical protein [Clostridium ganghwense]
MKYNSDHYYRIAYVITIVSLIPFFILVTEINKVTPIIIIFTPLIIGIEYSYIFPRQAMKLYEEILFKSFIERINTIIEFSIFIIFSATESYYFITGNIIPVFVFTMIYPIWTLIFKSQSVIIGNKNIIIGKKLIPYDLVQSVSLEKNSVLIKTDEQSFKISNWAIDKQRWKLELLLKQITDKTKD